MTNYERIYVKPCKFMQQRRIINLLTYLFNIAFCLIKSFRLKRYDQFPNQILIILQNVKGI